MVSRATPTETVHQPRTPQVHHFVTDPSKLYQLMKALKCSCKAGFSDTTPTMSRLKTHHSTTLNGLNTSVA